MTFSYSFSARIFIELGIGAEISKKVLATVVVNIRKVTICCNLTANREVRTVITTEKCRYNCYTYIIKRNCFHRNRKDILAATTVKKER